MPIANCESFEMEPLISNRQSEIENRKCTNSIVAILIGCFQSESRDRGEYTNQLT